MRALTRTLKAAAAALATAALITACGGGASAPSRTARSGASAHANSPSRAASTGANSPSRTASTGASAHPLPAPLARATPATLILDFTPNAVHAGIYRALAEGLYRREHIDLKVIQPSETQDTLSLIDAGRADFGLADGSDVANLIAAGGDAEAIFAIGQQPFGGLIARASEHLSSPAQLQGRTVGITGVPSDTAVLDTEVSAAGGDPARVHVVTVGFNGAEALRSGRIAAFTGFWPADGVQLQVTGEPVKSFKLSQWGGPPYPGLVAFSNRHLISSRPALVRDFVAATVRGYEETIEDPKRSLEDLLHANPEIAGKVAAASLKAYLPLFTEEGRVRFGTIQPAHVEAMSRWMLAHHLISKPVPFSRYATDAFLPGG